jgi:hypothetical protein
MFASRCFEEQTVDSPHRKVSDSYGDNDAALRRNPRKGLAVELVNGSYQILNKAKRCWQYWTLSSSNTMKLATF